ncbi:MAG TPA: hypothetical protein VMD78_11935, partial [Candidatus Baltobacteraceae bacterium]|nr:hypothetical protein [Candidatus Baltobacteraceae bacterium]
LNNPSRLNFDVSLSKTVKLKEDRSLEFRLETFNIFNKTQFRIYDPANPGNVGNNTITCFGGSGSDYSAAGDGDTSCLSNSFLRPIDAHRPRTMQLGVKFFF